MSETVTARQLADAVRQSRGSVVPSTHLGLYRGGQMVAAFTPDEFEREFATVRFHSWSTDHNSPVPDYDMPWEPYEPAEPWRRL